MNSAEGGLTAVLMSKAFRHIRTQSSSKFRHTVVTCNTTLKHGFMRKGPMGVAVRLDADYEVSSPVGGPQEGAMKITAHEVESIEEFCFSTLGTKKVCKLQLGKMNAGLMRLLREVAKPVTAWRAGDSLLTVSRGRRCG